MNVLKSSYMKDRHDSAEKKIWVVVSQLDLKNISRMPFLPSGEHFASGLLLFYPRPHPVQLVPGTRVTLPVHVCHLESFGEQA